MELVGIKWYQMSLLRCNNPEIAAYKMQCLTNS